jgi:hypothetical protein
MKFVIKRGVCQFCADEFREQFDKEHEGEDTHDWNKAYWKAYHDGMSALETDCVITGNYFDDFASGWDGVVEFFMCKRHLLEAAKALDS